MTGPANEPEPPRQPAEAVPSSDPDEPQTPAPAPKPPPPVAAPHWLSALLKPKPAPIDWKRAARAAVAVAAPIAVGMAVGQLSIGILVSIGSLVGTVTSVSGPYRDRWRRTGLAVLAGAIGFLLGDVVGEHGWWTTGLIVLVAAVSALLSAAGNNASLASLQLLVYVVLGTHESTVVGPGIAVGCFLGGAAFALLLSVAAWPVRATAPERALVATVYDQLSVLLSAAGTPAATGARQQLTAALNTAYDALLTARSHLQGRDQIYRRLFVALSETTPVVEAAVALLNARHRPPKSLIDAVAAIGVAIHDDAPVPELALPETGSPRVLALTEGLYGVIDAMSPGAPAPRLPAANQPRPSSDRFQTWLDEVARRPRRLAARAAHGRVHGCRRPAGRPAALRPVLLGVPDRRDRAQTRLRLRFRPRHPARRRHVRRRAGGCRDPRDQPERLGARAARGRHRLPAADRAGPQLRHVRHRAHARWSSSSWTSAGPAPGTSCSPALLDTVVGCAVVLIFGYLLWPASRTPQVGGQLADAIRAVGRYADQALRADPRGRSSLRRRTYRQLSDLRTEFQRVLVEPFTAGRRAAAWYPSIVALERLTSSITRIAVEIDHGEPIPPGAEVDNLVTSLAALADAVRDGAPVPEPPVSADPIIAPVCADVAQVIAGLRGPDLDSVRPFAPLRRLLPRVRQR